MRTRAGRQRTTIGKATTEESAVKLDTDYETFIEEVPSLNPSWQHIVVAIILQIKLAKAFGYPGAFAIGLIFLPNIFQLIMGFDNSKYIGPQ